jgi:hypothetical protein
MSTASVQIGKAVTSTPVVIYDAEDDPVKRGCSTFEIEWLSGDPIQVCVEGDHQLTGGTPSVWSPPFRRAKQYCAHGDRITKVWAKASDENGSTLNSDPLSRSSPAM